MIQWKGTSGYVEGRVVFRLIEGTNGWRVYLRGDPLDRVDYPDVDAARAAAVGALGRVLPLPEPPPRPERYGRKLPNRPVPQHPGEGWKPVANEPG